MKDTIVTEFGKANINQDGYYQITSAKEGNNGKRLHRLIYEKNFGTIPKGYVIHHKDRNRQNNCIMNLQLMTNQEHVSLHTQGENNPMYGIKGEKHPLFGRRVSEETRKKMSESRKGNNYRLGTKHSQKSKRRISIARNTSGYRNVYKKKSRTCKQGFAWTYTYYEGKKQKTIERINLNDLKEAVLEKGLVWEEYSKQEM